MRIGIPRALLFYYYNNLWISFFKKLNIELVYSDDTNRKILERGQLLANDEACLSLKNYLGHIDNLLSKNCNYILVPRLYCIRKNESTCTNYNALYDLVNNTFDDINILSYNFDIEKKKTELLGFISMGKTLGISYINSYIAYRYAKRKHIEKRITNELKQEIILKKPGLKILIAGHPYNLYDSYLSKDIEDYLKNQNINIIFSDRINHTIIDSECRKLSTDVHWTHSKEIIASINYYKDKVDGIIILSSFPCGPDSLTNELVKLKIKQIPILSIVMDGLNSNIGTMTRLESFIDIIFQKKEKSHERNN